MPATSLGVQRQRGSLDAYLGVPRSASHARVLRRALVCGACVLGGISTPGVATAAPGGSQPTQEAKSAARNARPPTKAVNTAAQDKAEAAQKKGATLTAWYKHGGEKWTVCSELALEAERALPTFHDQAQHLGAGHAWANRAKSCPHALKVLELAARKEALHLVRLPDGVNGQTDLTRMLEELSASRERALQWLDEAQLEAKRRGDPTPPQLDYWRARALLSLGRLEASRAALVRSRARGDVLDAKLLRLEALLALYCGELERAEGLARQAWLSAPRVDGDNREMPDRVLAAAVYALVLDRSGDDEGAQRMMELADRNGDRGAIFLQRLESFMPIAERLYFRALWMATVRGRDARLARRFFEAYLARPEVAEPERKLAERHIARLRKKPGRLGG